ncbi:MAG: hypothetical protein KBG15_05690 [Kofleriaceae bacterium]|nr:hypothetical protein [Kofleriaceae bacterium]
MGLRIIATVGIATASACYDSPSKDPATDAITNGDAPKIVDGNGAQIDSATVRPDAAMSTAILGAACTGQGQGTCPVGYNCLNLQGGSGSWCSNQCTMGTGDTCDAGYTGPGVAACVLNVTPSTGGTPQAYCAVICQDAPGAPTLCAPATRCTSVCATPLVCNGPLTTTTGTVVGQICK